MTREMNQRDEKLSAALRELASCSRQNASPEVGLTLKDAFRRHHARRRQITRLRISLVCLCVAGLAGLFLLKSSSNLNSVKPKTVQTIPPQEVLPPPEMSVSSTQQTGVKRTSPNRKTSIDADRFWALPAFDLIPSGDQLRVVRLQMRGEDLRLVGAPVSDEIVRHRVTADFVVGHDGTPYAVRLVQANF